MEFASLVSSPWTLGLLKQPSGSVGPSLCCVTSPWEAFMWCIGDHCSKSIMVKKLSPLRQQRLWFSSFKCRWTESFSSLSVTAVLVTWVKGMMLWLLRNNHNIIMSNNETFCHRAQTQLIFLTKYITAFHLGIYKYECVYQIQISAYRESTCIIPQPKKQCHIKAFSVQDCAVELFWEMVIYIFMRCL